MHAQKTEKLSRTLSALLPFNRTQQGYRWQAAVVIVLQVANTSSTILAIAASSALH